MNKATLLFVFLTVSSPMSQRRDQIIGYIAGLPVYRAELQREEARYRADVYGSAGVNPQNRLKVKAWIAMKFIKVQEGELKKHHLWPFKNYPEFLNALGEVNRTRQRGAVHREILYGPVTYSETAYFDYRVSLAALALQKRWRIDEHDYQDIISRRAARAISPEPTINRKILVGRSE
jgi:hypothetical protein